MKKLSIFSQIFFLLIPFAAISAGLPNFSASERVLRIPQVTVDDKNLFYDVELYLDFENRILSVQNYSDKPPSDAIAELNLPFKLVMGQSTQISGTDLSIQFSDVTEDSRCPSRVVCGWAGQVVVIIDTTRTGKSPEKIALTSLNFYPVIHNLSDYNLELLNVQPYPEDTLPNKEDYMITLRVVPLSP